MSSTSSTSKESVQSYASSEDTELFEPPTFNKYRLEVIISCIGVVLSLIGIGYGVYYFIEEVYQEEDGTNAPTGS